MLVRVQSQRFVQSTGKHCGKQERRSMKAETKLPDLWACQQQSRNKDSNGQLYVSVSQKNLYNISRWKQTRCSLMDEWITYVYNLFYVAVLGLEHRTLRN